MEFWASHMMALENERKALAANLRQLAAEIERNEPVNILEASRVTSFFSALIRAALEEAEVKERKL